uniref:Uncharacterized protein n=1 Tax=Chlamydomonas euryale TaxID=1486919 RepID=A0A7R9V232_9CHLO
MAPSRDQLHLVVSKAYDTTGVVKQTSVRMITSFSVQASVAKHKAVRRLFKEAAEKALPPVIEEEGIDVLMIQAPRSRDLSPYVIQMLCSAKTAVLVWPPDADAHAIGRHSAASADGNGGDQAASLARDLQTRASINASIGRGSLSHDGSTLSGPVSRAGALRTPDESAPPLAPLHSKALPPLPPTVADGPGSLGCGGGPRTLRSASSMPSGRRGAATGRYSSARYGYLADPPPRADTATEAAMAAMAARVQRRRDAEERATLGALNSQRRGAVL